MADLQIILHNVLLSTAALLAITNPFGNLPQFLHMTDGYPPAVKQKLFKNITYTAVIIVLLFLLGGPLFMKYLFRIDMADLRIAGGLILVVMGVKNLLFPLATRSTFASDESEEELVRKSIIPMAFPMLVGPGTLATVIVMLEDNGILIAILAIIVTFAFMRALFHYSASIERVFGKLVLHVLARIMQVFIVAIGVNMFITGLKGTISIFIK